MAKVTVHFEDKNLDSRTLEGDFKGTSLLDLIEDNGMHLNSNCGAVCACSTCHVYIEEGDEYLKEITDREEDFIDRAIDPTLESRLGCQCEILDNSAEITVKVPNQDNIIGHEH